MAPRKEVLSLGRQPLKPVNEMSTVAKHNKWKRTKTKSKRKKIARQLKISETEEEVMEEIHLLRMDNIARVHNEAASQFRKRREALHALNLKRTAPKHRKYSARTTPEPTPICNPSAEEIGWKVGKSHYLIRVGQVENLYITTKSLKKSSQNLNTAETLDLHGYSKARALDALDQCLPKWVDAAMKAEHPWVIEIKIVCGAGNQELSQVVEGWIKRTKEVANAPKCA